MFRLIGAAAEFVQGVFKFVAVLICAVFAGIAALLFFALRSGASHVPAANYSSPQPVLQQVARPSPEQNRLLPPATKRRDDFVIPAKQSEEVHVKGHYRNGKWVAPHTRKKPH